jgi:hypothetical protein
MITMEREEQAYISFPDLPTPSPLEYYLLASSGNSKATHMDPGIFPH